jgi:hypothetical protein
MSPFDFGALGFWLFVAALLVGGMWKESRQQAEKHETLRRIVEKTGVVDEAKLKELFSSAGDTSSAPGTGYRALRIGGTIIMFAGAGMALFFLIPTLIGHPIDWWYGGVAIAAGITLLGLGVFSSSRFAEQPPGTQYESKSL